VAIPPLRKRLDDIPLLLDHFMEKAANAMHKKKPSPPKELYSLLTLHSFPGNVRELEGMVLDAVAQHESKMLSMAVFEARICLDPKTENASLRMQEAEIPYVFFDKLPTLKDSAAQLIAEAMRRAEGNQSIAARLLGISRTALNKRLNSESE
jgi:DNA-binding NtrC family response regulator